MKLLICCQTLDQDDPSLGFFHDWVAALAPAFEQVTVICLQQGRCALPANVTAHSLGKEAGARSSLSYAVRAVKLAFALRHQYDRAFVHMNQEYILACGWLWKLLRKPTYLWYNHYSGSWLTDVAASFCKKIFYTSAFSYTSKYQKSVQMPVGVDTERFSATAERIPNSVLSLGRISSSKRLDAFIAAVNAAAQQHPCTASIYGPTVTKEDEAYLQELRSQAGKATRFHAGIPASETPAVYAAHSIFVNAAKSGMYDKALFEAAASGCIVLAASEDFRKLAGDAYWFDPDQEGSLVSAILRFLTLPAAELEAARAHMRVIARSHSFASLMEALPQQLRD